MYTSMKFHQMYTSICPETRPRNKLFPPLPRLSVPPVPSQSLTPFKGNH